MERVGNLHLLTALKKAWPDGISEFGSGQTMVYELLSIENNSDDFLSLLDAYWPHTRSDEDELYLLDLADIDFIGPSAASALIEGVVNFATGHSKPCILINVGPEVREGLQTCRYVQSHHHVVCAFDTDHQRHYIGEVQERLRRVLDELESNSSPNVELSASDLAERAESGPGKSNINRFSVYLQDLYNLRLVIRRKVGGSERQDAERSWTYLYRSVYPTVRALLQEETSYGHP